MRGKLAGGVHRMRLERITPAHAGKTKSTASMCSACADHPRACGENLPNKKSSPWLLGSPPRMRGKQRRQSSMRRRRRITPAHAGKTSRCSSLCRHPADHPRACGENWRRSRRPTSRDGSPPRMRGKLGESIFARKRPRITPAHAGKTRPLCARCPLTADHPRACGENCYF